LRPGSLLLFLLVFPPAQPTDGCFPAALRCRTSICGRPIDRKWRSRRIRNLYRDDPDFWHPQWRYQSAKRTSGMVSFEKEMPPTPCLDTPFRVQQVAEITGGDKHLAVWTERYVHPPESRATAYRRVVPEVSLDFLLGFSTRLLANSVSSAAFTQNVSPLIGVTTWANSPVDCSTTTAPTLLWLCVAC
jgi:hypothetical protein